MVLLIWITAISGGREKSEKYKKSEKSENQIKSEINGKQCTFTYTEKIRKNQNKSEKIRKNLKKSEKI